MKVKVCKDHTLNHDNHAYAEGTVLELEADQAQELIDAGVVKEVTEKKEAPTSADAPKQAEAPQEVEVKGVVNKGSK